MQKGNDLFLQAASHLKVERILSLCESVNGVRLIEEEILGSAILKPSGCFSTEFRFTLRNPSASKGTIDERGWSGAELYSLYN